RGCLSPRRFARTACSEPGLLRGRLDGAQGDNAAAADGGVTERSSPRVAEAGGLRGQRRPRSRATSAGACGYRSSDRGPGGCFRALLATSDGRQHAIELLDALRTAGSGTAWRWWLVS